MSRQRQHLNDTLGQYLRQIQEEREQLHRTKVADGARRFHGAGHVSVLRHQRLSGRPIIDHRGDWRRVEIRRKHSHDEERKALEEESHACGWA